MGDMADLYNYWDDNPQEEEEEEVIDRLHSGIWLTADQKEIKITEMETSHIVNTIRFIENKLAHDDYMSEYLPKLRAELGGRG